MLCAVASKLAPLSGVVVVSYEEVHGFMADYELLGHICRFISTPLEPLGHSGVPGSHPKSYSW